MFFAFHKLGSVPEAAYVLDVKTGAVGVKTLADLGIVPTTMDTVLPAYLQPLKATVRLTSSHAMKAGRADTVLITSPMPSGKGALRLTMREANALEDPGSTD